jgi:hypothetical protein
MRCGHRSLSRGAPRRPAHGWLAESRRSREAGAERPQHSESGIGLLAMECWLELARCVWVVFHFGLLLNDGDDARRRQHDWTNAVPQ